MPLFTIYEESIYFLGANILPLIVGISYSYYFSENIEATRQSQLPKAYRDALPTKAKMRQPREPTTKQEDLGFAIILFLFAAVPMRIGFEIWWRIATASSPVCWLGNPIGFCLNVINRIFGGLLFTYVS